MAMGPACRGMLLLAVCLQVFMASTVEGYPMVGADDTELVQLSTGDEIPPEAKPQMAQEMMAKAQEMMAKAQKMMAENQPNQLKEAAEPEAGGKGGKAEAQPEAQSEAQPEAQPEAQSEAQ